jgi:hypothetical protein
MRPALRPVLAAAIAAVCLTVVAAPAARADDAAMKASIPAAFDALSKKEAVANKAIARFNKYRAKVAPQSRKAIRSVRRSVAIFSALLSAQQTSTPAGDSAKQALLKALALESKATTQLDLAMKASRTSSRARTNRIIRRANATLARANTAGRVAVGQIVAL